MSNYNPSIIGQAAGAGDQNALFLKLFSGEVITAFERANTALDRTMVRTISQGKSATFPVFGKASAAYHSAGTELTGSSIVGNERVITIQDLLVSHVFIASIEEAKSSWEVRSIYAKELGNALATQMDKHIYQVLVNASRAGAASPQSAGQQVTSANFLTSGATAASAIYEAARKLDEADVPAEDRYVAVSPQVYYNMVGDTTAAVINRDFNNGNNGSYSDGKVLRIAGIEVVKTNNLPAGTISSGTGIGSVVGSTGSLGGTYTNTVGVVWQKSAAGSLKLLDLSSEMEYSARHQGTLLVAKYAAGHGILRPEASIEIKTA
jgi:hypothetical protein